MPDPVTDEREWTIWVCGLGHVRVVVNDRQAEVGSVRCLHRDCDDKPVSICYPVPVVPKSSRAAVEAERDRYRAALERIADMTTGPKNDPLIAFKALGRKGAALASPNDDGKDDDARG